MESSGKLSLDDIQLFQQLLKCGSIKAAEQEMGKDRNFLYRLLDRIKSFIGDPNLKKNWRIGDPEIPVEVHRLFQGYERLVTGSISYPLISAGSLIAPLVQEYIFKHASDGEMTARGMMVRSRNIVRSLRTNECDLAFLHRLQDAGKTLAAAGEDMIPEEAPETGLATRPLGDWIAVAVCSKTPGPAWLASWERDSSADRITEQAIGKSPVLREALDPEAEGRRQYRFGSYLDAIEAMRRGAPIRLALPDVLVPPDVIETAQIVWPETKRETSGQLYAKFRESETKRLEPFLNKEKWQEILRPR